MQIKKNVDNYLRLEENEKNKFQNTIKCFLKIMDHHRSTIAIPESSKMKRKILKIEKKWSKRSNFAFLGWLCPSLVMGLAINAFLYIPAKIQLRRS